MEEINDEEFINFIESFKNLTFEDENKQVHKLYDSLTELSKSDSGSHDSIIINSQQMYGLDWIVKSCDKWKDMSIKCKKNPKRCRHKFPKSTDALFFKKNQHDRLELHIIEFKFVPKESNTSKLDNLYQKIIDKNNAYILSKSTSKQEKRCFDNKFIEDFENIKEDYVDSIEHTLQLKPFETLYIVLPGLYEEYCKNAKVEKKDIRVLSIIQ